MIHSQTRLTRFVILVLIIKLQWDFSQTKASTWPSKNVIVALVCACKNTGGHSG